MIKNYSDYLNESLNFTPDGEGYTVSNLKECSDNEIVETLNRLFKDKYVLIEDINGVYDSVISLIEEFVPTQHKSLYACEFHSKKQTYNYNGSYLINVDLDEGPDKIPISFRDVITILKPEEHIIKRVISDIDPYGEEIWENKLINFKKLNPFNIFKKNHYKNITVLNLSDKGLTELPDLSNLTNLERLSCSNNRLTELPDLSNLTNLRVLYCDNNQLTELPDLSNLSNLKYLYCDNNQLTELPDLNNLTNLRELYCHNNRLTELPDLSNLTNLRVLSCSNNQLTELPDLSNLSNLKYLYCSDNQLTELSDLSNLTNIEILYCFNNQLPYNNLDEYKKWLKQNKYTPEEKERIRLSKLNIDPYGEEDWLDENNKYVENQNLSSLNNLRKLSHMNEEIQYNKQLSQDIWDDNILIDRIRKKLINIAKDFFKDVELDTEIIDIRLCGSMANYNYTDESDIDVHIIIDFEDINKDTELVKMAIDGERFIWNLRHNISIKGHDVELYIQDNKEEHTSTGLFSLLNNEWIKKPTYDPPNIDDKEVYSKYKSKVYDINKLSRISKKDLTPEEAEEYYEMSKELKNKIMKSRKTGLLDKGEFSIENLVFKRLRSENYIGKLINVITRLYDKIYSQ